MTTEQVALIVSCVALVLTVIDLVWTYRVDKKATAATDLANKISMGGAEINVLSVINDARNRTAELSIAIHNFVAGRKPRDLNADETRHITSMESVYHESIERLLNCYELGCGLYLDGKLDKARFKRQYYEELKKLFSSTSPHGFKNRLHAYDSPYKAMRKVYEEWCNLEAN